MVQKIPASKMSVDAILAHQQQWDPLLLKKEDRDTLLGEVYTYMHTMEVERYREYLDGLQNRERLGQTVSDGSD